MDNQSLTSKTINGVGWSFAETLLRLGITFLVSVVLARLLGPEEYGLIGILAIFINLFNAIVDSGFTNALIRKNDITDVDYSTVFITNLIVSVALTLLLFFCSPFIAAFFERPQLEDLTKVMSIIVIINAFGIVQSAKLTKDINFKVQTKVSLLSSIISGIVGIGMALIGSGVWALVGQQVSARLLNTLFLFFYNRWIPKLFFSWISFKEMFGFGWKLMFSTIIATLWNEIYQVVIGKCYSPVTLGYYTRAHQFSSLCSSNLTAVVQRVSYPVLSSIQDDKLRLKNAYQRIIKTTMLPTFILMIGMAAVANPMVYLLIGSKWLPCVPMLQLLCFNMMLYPLHSLNLNMLQVEGRSDLYLKLEIIKKIIAVGPIVLGIFVGIYWMLIGSVLMGFVSYYLNAYYSGQMLDYGMKEQIIDILPSFTIALIMAIVIFSLNYFNIAPFILLPLQIVVGASIVVFLCCRYSIQEYYELKNMILSLFKKL